MKILVIGSGGREHAILWKLSQSPLVSELYCAPGNPGISQLAKCLPIPVENTAELLRISREIGINLTVVGPEVPLVSGIVDEFREAGLSIIGPDRQAAELEGSKAFSKYFMERYAIPTAKFHRVTTVAEGIECLDQYSLPVVVKADGLAAGKGVLICETKEEAVEGLKDILEKRIFGDSGFQVVIEEFLEGIETSILCFVDGKTIVPMVGSQDHKRIFDGDQGPNTGGMGTYSPNYIYTEQVAEQVQEQILLPTLKGIQAEGMDYRGILFVGLMISKDGPKVLEYNVRFGDPETQVVLPRLETDLVAIFQHMLVQELSAIDIKWSKNAAVCVVLASGGYPAAYAKGISIDLKGIENSDDLMIFHAGTSEKNGQLVTAGGRVLGVTGVGTTIDDARRKAYWAANQIEFEGKQFRNDIALK